MSKFVPGNLALEDYADDLFLAGYAPYFGTITLTRRSSSKDGQFADTMYDAHWYRTPDYDAEYKEGEDGTLLVKQRELPLLARTSWTQPRAIRQNRQQGLRRNVPHRAMLEGQCWQVEQVAKTVYEAIVKEIVPATEWRDVPCLTAPIYLHFLELTDKGKRKKGIHPLHVHFLIFVPDCRCRQFEKFVRDDVMALVKGNALESQEAAKAFKSMKARIQGLQIKPLTYFVNQTDGQRSYFPISYAEAEQHPVIGSRRGIFPDYYLDHKHAYLPRSSQRAMAA